jgi:copper chaperone
LILGLALISTENPNFEMAYRKKYKEGLRMTKQTLSIPNISCGHCVMAIKNESSELEGVATVEGDPGDKSVTVEFEAPATLEQIKETLKEINYPAA